MNSSVKLTSNHRGHLRAGLQPCGCICTMTPKIPDSNLVRLCTLHYNQSMPPMLVTFLINGTKYLTKSNIKEKSLFISAFWAMQSVLVGRHGMGAVWSLVQTLKQRTGSMQPDFLFFLFTLDDQSRDVAVLVQHVPSCLNSLETISKTLI